MSPPLAFATVALEKMVLELRYEDAYIFWDRTGSLWEQIRHKWPELSPLTTEPNRTHFTSQHSGEDLVVELNKCRYAVRAPDAFNKFSESCEIFLDIVLPLLEINILRRVGLRMIFSQEYQSQLEASAAVMHTGLLKVPQGISQHLPKGGKLLLPQFVIRAEGDAIGCLYQVRVETRRVLLESSFDLKIPPINKETHHAICDIDYYTTATIRRDQFSTRDWLSSGIKYIRRDAERLLKGI